MRFILARCCVLQMLGLFAGACSESSNTDVVSNSGADAGSRFVSDVRTGVDPGTPIVFGPFAIDQITVPSSIAISGGEYAIDNDSFTQDQTTIAPGQQVRVRVSSACALKGTKDAILTIGNHSAAFRTVTKESDVALVSIAFPPGNALADSNELTVMGTTAMPNAIHGVRINNVDATSDNGFATWRAKVSTPIGDTKLIVETDGVYCQNPIVVNHSRTPSRDLKKGTGPAFREATAMAVDFEGSRLFVVDQEEGALFFVDIKEGYSFGTRAMVSASNENPELEAPVGLGFDRREQRVVMVDRARNALLSINVKSGEQSGHRTIVSEPHSGVSVQSVVGLTWDSGDRRVLLINDELDALIAVELPPDAQGERSVVSSASKGAGPSIIDPLAISLDATRHRALVVTQTSVLSVDLTTGDRALVSDATCGSKPTWSTTVHAMVVDPTQDRAFFIDGLTQDLFAVELSSNTPCDNRSILTRLTEPTWAMAYHDLLHVAFVSTQPGPFAAIRAIELKSGDQVLISQ